MKTRIIQTRFWDDEFVSDLDLQSQHLYIYLITCQYINISGIFQLPVKKILLESRLDEKEFEKSQKILAQSKKVFFYKGWVYVVNALKNNNYVKSPKNLRAYEKELEQIPVDVKEYFDTTINSSIDSHTTISIINHKSETQNKKKEDKIKREGTKKYEDIDNVSDEDKQEIAELYQVPLSFVESKYDDMRLWAGSQPSNKKLKGRNWKVTLMQFVKRDSLELRDKARKEAQANATKLGIDARSVPGIQR